MPAPRVLLLIPPLTQLNTPYPSAPYLTGFLRSRGYPVAQADLGIEMVLALYSRRGLTAVFEQLRARSADLPGEARQMLAMSQTYLQTVEPIIQFLQGKDPSLATRICQRTLLPEGPRFAHARGSGARSWSPLDQAKHLATLYVEDLADLVTHTITPHFALSRYAEQVGTLASSFEQVLAALNEAPSLTDRWMIEALDRHMADHRPTLVGLSVPFPGNLYGAFRLAHTLKSRWPQVAVALGGGYVNTELRRLSDPRVFDYIDYVTLDDGERPFLTILEHLSGQRPDAQLCRTFRRSGGKVVYHNGAPEPDITMAELGPPTYDGLDLDRYLSILDTTNPMHRLWSDGHWNKLTVAHGCYWKQCTFCDVGLDYIGRYDATPDQLLLDRIEALIAETGRRGFHFVDEAAPPAALSALALGLLERGLSVSWWGNIRFEKSFTPDLCRLLAASGCIAVSAGLEVASDRLLANMKKGITVDQTAQVAAAFRSAGILIHAYLMYGFPSETVEEALESLERVRQLFAADLIQSAFWHRFVATAHSPVGLNPKAHGIRILGPSFDGFAENDLSHLDATGGCPEWIGTGLRSAIGNYMERQGLKTPVARWFTERVPRPDIPSTWARTAARGAPRADARVRQGRMVWLGEPPVIEGRRGTRTTMVFPTKQADTVLRLPHELADWLSNVVTAARPLGKAKDVPYPSLESIRQRFPAQSVGGFERWTRDPAWRRVRAAGLLIL